MNPQIRTIRLILIIGSFLMSTCPADALDFDIQPRLEAGMISYSFEQSAASRSSPTKFNDLKGFNETQQEIEFSTTMGFIGGGVTLFVNRMFVDLSGQYTAEGDDQLRVASSTFNEPGPSESGSGTYTSVALGYDAQIDRRDQAVSLGYAVTKSFSVFAGYKWAVSDQHSAVDGTFSSLTISDEVRSGRMTGHEDIEFKYNGPFVGGTHGWQVGSNTKFQGVISVNAGLAKLNSKLSRRRHITLVEESAYPQDNAPRDPTSMVFIETIKGDTLGLALGLSWRGITPLENLSYSLGISGHRYQFDSKDSRSMDISETAVSFKVGVAYVF